MRSPALHALLLVLVSTSLARAQPDGLDPSEIARVRRAVASNSFNTARGVADYVAFFKGTLAADMKTWRAGMRVLDGGAGQARFLGEALAASPSRFDAIAVGVTRPAVVWDNVRGAAVTVPVPEGVTYVEGLIGDAASDFELEKRIGLGTIDRIVDVYGASAYAPALDKVLEGYGRLLKPGGKLYLHFDTGVTRLQDASGKPLSIASYARRIGGFEVTDSLLQGDTKFMDGSHLVLVLERTSAPLSVPALRLTTFTAWTPPHRAYATDLPAFAAPEDAAMKAFAAAGDLERSLRWRGFVLPFTPARPVLDAELRELVVTRDRKVLTFDLEGTTSSYKNESDRLFQVSLSDLATLRKGGAEAFGTFDRIIADARAVDPAKLEPLLRPGGRLDVVERTGITERIRSSAKEKVRVR